MGDTLAALLPYFNGAPLVIPLVIVYRLWLRGAVRQERLEAQIDEERRHRRKVEDSMAVLKGQLDDCARELKWVRRRLGDTTSEVT